MARQVRIQFAGAVYHVMSRGNNGNGIFFGNKGGEKFLDTLDEACQRTGWIVHAYVLMGNHYHLLIETPEANLVDGMKWLQGTYTQRVNAWRQRRGHLFQGRYKAHLVNAENKESKYFQTVADYIHLNPARAKMVGKGKRWDKLRDYPWSSLPRYCGWKAKRPSWLEVDRVLESYCFEDNAVGRKAYMKYIEAKGLEDGESYEELRRGWCLGDGNFRQRMLDKAEKALSVTKKGSLSGSAVRKHNENDAGKMLVEGLQRLGISSEALPKMKKSAVEKQALATWLAKNSLASSEWIATHLSMGHPSSVTQAKAWCRESKEGQKWLAKLK